MTGDGENLNLLADEIKNAGAELNRLIELGAKRGLTITLTVIPIHVLGTGTFPDIHIEVARRL
jgi:hypothetical protein